MGKENAMQSILGRLNRQGSFDTTAVIRVLLVAAGLIVAAGVFSGGVFLQPSNLVNLGLQNVVLILVALGQLLVILSGGIDLSVGATLALSSVMVVLFQDYGLIPAILIALTISAALGLVNGASITYLRLPSFVVTLGMMQIAYSLAMVFSQGGAVYTGTGGAEIAPALLGVYQGAALGIPYPLLLSLVGLAALGFYLRTREGHFVYPLGGNERAAYFSGVPVRRVRMLVYVIASVLAGIGGVLYVSRVGLGYPQAGQWLPLDTIAAVSIGGASLAGGMGTVVGTFVGVLILGVLNNIVNLLGVPPTLEPAVKGLVILVAVLLNARQHKN
jgi:ribose transport system permease protein